MMERRSFVAAVVLLAALPLVLVPAAEAQRSTTAQVKVEPNTGTEPKPRPAVPFSTAQLRVEINATDGDAGAQIMLDGTPWKEVEISNPGGDEIFNVSVGGRVKKFGFTELFSESSEPPFTQFPLERFKKLFPAGKYKFSGTTIDGKTLEGESTLTHNFPAGPVIALPGNGTSVPSNNAVIKWRPVTTPAGIHIVRYDIVVSGDQSLSVELPATARELRIPADFLAAGAEYKVEVAAFEVGGNRTFTEIAFTAR